MIAHDRYAQSNPALCAACIVWGVLALVLLLPKQVRNELPKSGAASLTILFHEKSQWKLGLPSAMKAHSPHFWQGVRLAVATGTIAVEAGRLRAIGQPERPATDDSIDLRKRALALGQMLAKAGTDAAVGAAVGLTVVA
jgi:hypothetical protein